MKQTSLSDKIKAADTNSIGSMITSTTKEPRMQIDKVLTTDQVKQDIADTVANHLSFDEEHALYEFNRLSYEALNKKDNDNYWNVYWRVLEMVEDMSHFMAAVNSHQSSFKADITAEIVKIVAEHVRVKINNKD